MCKDNDKKHLGAGQESFHEVFSAIIGGSIMRPWLDDSGELYECIGTISDYVIDGTPGSVDFAGNIHYFSELDDEYNCVIGFHHTHPSGMNRPSTTDINTMDAWVRFLGKPLVLTIYCDDEMLCFVFQKEGWTKIDHYFWDGNKKLAGSLMPGELNKYNFAYKKLTIKGGGELPLPKGRGFLSKDAQHMLAKPTWPVPGKKCS